MFFKPLPISPQLLRWTQVVVFQFYELSHTRHAVLTFQIVPTVRKNTREKRFSVSSAENRKENYLVPELKSRKWISRKIQHTVVKRTNTKLKRSNLYF